MKPWIPVHITMHRHSLPHAAPALELLAYMFTHIRAVIWPWMTPANPLGVLLGQFYTYLPRALRRIDALYLRWQAGTLPATLPPTPRTKRPDSPEAAPGTPDTTTPPRFRLPRGKMWLIKHIQQTALGQLQLQMLLDRPDFAAFLAEVPRAGRLIRPLCTALGVDLPPALRLPPRLRRLYKPKPPNPDKPRSGKPSAAEIRRWRNYCPGKIRPFWKPT